MRNWLEIIGRAAVLGALLAIPPASVIGCGDDDAASKGDAGPDSKDASTSAPNNSSGGKGGSAGAAGKTGTGGKPATTPSANGRHSISGSVTASVATGVVMTLSGAADAVVVPDVRGVYHFDNLADGAYVVTPSLFGYGFQPPSRAVSLDGDDAIAKDFAAIADNAACKTGFEVGPIIRGGAYTDVTSGDFDGDDKLDLVAIDGSNSVSVFLGNGDGSLAALVGFAAGDGSRYVHAADVDDDGKLDLVATAQHGNIAVLLGNGDGTFADPIEHMVATSGDGTKAAVADFDDDGKLDVAVGVTGAKSIAVLLGKGDGTFGDAVNYLSGATCRAVTAGDFDGDGKLDLAGTQSAPDAVSVLLGKGDGTFETSIAYPVGKFPYSIVAGDFNADDSIDLATCNNNGTNLSVLINDGKAKFASSVQYRAEGMPFSITSGDFNGDGKLDLISGDGAVVGVGLYLGAGDGTFGPMTATISPATGVTAGDFDGDGKLDVGVAGGGGVAILHNCR